MGSNFIRYVFRHTEFKGRIINVDSLTYAGDPGNLSDLAGEEKDGRYELKICDICNREALNRIFSEETVDGVVHFAAESHVDRSIASAGAFATTNVVGTLVLLEAAREAWQGRTDVHFHHISTDEVFGSCEGDAEFAEIDRYNPSSPYAASKAGADHMVRAFGHTHGFPYTITNATNNYGPCQTPEKLIPLVIMKLLNEEKIPVYGKGDNVREWLYVDDHSRAVWEVVTRGKQGSSYNAGSKDRVQNIDLIHMLGKESAKQLDRDPDYYKDLITYVTDRPGHDKRYALDSTKIRTELDWKQQDPLQKGIEKTVAWYLANTEWVERARERIKSWLESEGTTWAKIKQ